MNYIQTLIEANRQKGTTTSLVQAVRMSKGYLICGHLEIKNKLLKKYPDLQGHIFSLSEIRDGKLSGLTPGALFFDTETVYGLSKGPPLTTEGLTLISEWERQDGFGKNYIARLYIDKYGCHYRSIDEEIEKITVEDFERHSKLYSIICKPIYPVYDGYQQSAGSSDKVSDLTESIPESDGYNVMYNRQINVKLTDEDVKQLKIINIDFFEGEATNSMMGRILLRKGIQFYKKLRDSF